MRHSHDSDSAPHHTSMIDVVFLLLIFFLVVSVPELRLAVNDVNRVSGGESVDATRPVRVDVLPDGYAVDGRRVDRAGLDRLLRDIAPYMGSATLLFTSRDDASHEQLMVGLDICQGYGLTNIAIGRGG